MCAYSQLVCQRPSERQPQAPTRPRFLSNNVTETLTTQGKPQAHVRMVGKELLAEGRGLGTAAADDKKLLFSLKKSGANNISGMEEVSVFTNQRTAIHCDNPDAQAPQAADTSTLTGHAETKQPTEMRPSISRQLGADSLTSLRRLAEALPNLRGEAPLAPGEDDGDEVPDLVGNSDEASKNKAT